MAKSNQNESKARRQELLELIAVADKAWEVVDGSTGSLAAHLVVFDNGTTGTTTPLFQDYTTNEMLREVTAIIINHSLHVLSDEYPPSSAATEGLWRAATFLNHLTDHLLRHFAPEENSESEADQE